MHCASWVRTDIRAAFIPMGYGAQDLQMAYGLTSAAASNGATQTVAIVDAFDNPNAEADLAVYRTQFGLPACTTNNGCFMKVNQNGIAGSYPPTDPLGLWESEEILDLDMASAICPNCEIILVEADDNSNLNLYAAENTAAVTCAASVVSNSWDGGEYNGENSDEVNFNHGIPITVAGGDSGYDQVGVDGYPSSSAYVTAVGGTTLPCVGCVESVWPLSGSICSVYISQPSWQTALGSSYTSVCSTRITNDVAAVGDPNTGVAVYDSYGSGGWTVFGGTSVATPIIAGVYALAGSVIGNGSLPYGAPAGSLHDITSGSNDTGSPSCGGNFLCNAEPGYDGPSGNGTPNGIGGF